MATRRAQFIVLAVAIAAAGVGWWWTAEGPRHPRVLLIGIDGADPAIIDTLIADGKLPTFARLRSEGSYRPSAVARATPLASHLDNHRDGP